MSSQPITAELRSRSARGATAGDLVRWLQEHVGASFSVFDFARHFQEAFDVPLSTLLEAEQWVGFGKAGDLSDDELQALLGSWL